MINDFIVVILVYNITEELRYRVNIWLKSDMTKRIGNTVRINVKIYIWCERSTLTITKLTKCKQLLLRNNSFNILTKLRKIKKNITFYYKKKQKTFDLYTYYIPNKTSLSSMIWNNTDLKYQRRIILLFYQFISK